MRLDGQVVVVTGASKGLGRAIALACAEEGARLVLAARNRDALSDVAGQIDRLGAEVLVVGCDVRDVSQLRQLAERSVGEFGRIDCLFNSAGIGLKRPIADVDPAAWDDVFDTLVRGTFLAIQAVLPTMIEGGKGNIINLTAPLERIEIPGFAAYTAAKYAVVGLTKTLAKELRRYGINVNGLHPGGFADTEMVRGVIGNVQSGLLDPAVVTPAALALAEQPRRGLTGEIVDALGWNRDTGLGGGVQ
ncbi:MAG: SDR family oxidoreductase [Herpetosiphon sp.]